MANIISKLISWNRARKLKKQANLARKYLKSMDMTLKAMGMPRWKVKQFWRDFQKNDLMRERFFDAGSLSK